MGQGAKTSGHGTPRTERGTGGYDHATNAALVEVLVAEEGTRAHGFASVLAAVSLCTAACLPLLGGHTPSKIVCGSVLVLIGLVSLLVRHKLQGWSPERAPYPRVFLRGYGVLLSLGVVSVEYYFGLFSPVPVILTFGVYYFGHSSDRFQWLVMSAFVIACYTALSSLTAFGVIEDRGLFTGGPADVGARIFAVCTVTAVLLFTLRLARVSRQAMRQAIERSNEAVIVAQRREAQLAEAHHQLDRALQIAVGKPGRYTGLSAGEFRLLEVIGVGAIGEVYAAEREADGAQAAVKLLQVSALGREDLVERTLREGMITSSLNSPHVVRVIDVGRMPDGAPYLTMERLRGRDLGARLRQEGLLGLPELKQLAQQVGAGLQHAHEAEIIHRDLKPMNIFEAEQDGTRVWKVLDFGVSRLASSSGTLTQEGVVGTPGYMSPEQARGAALDQRSDVFSLAVVLYRALTGQPAFPGESTPQVMFDVVYKMPKQPGAVVKGLPSDIDAVMAIGLAKSADERFQSASELAAAFTLAAERALPAELRGRGAKLMRAAPWGSALAPRSSVTSDPPPA